MFKGRRHPNRLLHFVVAAVIATAAMAHNAQKLAQGAAAAYLEVNQD